MPSNRRFIVSGAVAAAVLGALGTSAPASATTPRGPAADGRTTTVRAACAGGGLIVVTVDQPPDGTVAVAAEARHLPLDSVWDGEIDVVSGDTHTGGGAGFGGQQPDADGTITQMMTVGVTTNPIVRLNFHSQDGSRTCIVRTQVERQWARTTCTLTGRLLSLTAVHDGADIDIASKLTPVPAASAWNASASVTSPHASEGAATAAHASAAGVVRMSVALGYAVNRTIAVSFANPTGNGCTISLGTHRLPPG